MAIISKANKVNLFVSSALFVFWYHSPNFLDTPRILISCYSYFMLSNFITCDIKVTHSLCNYYVTKCYTLCTQLSTAHLITHTLLAPIQHQLSLLYTQFQSNISYHSCTHSSNPTSAITPVHTALIQHQLSFLYTQLQSNISYYSCTHSSNPTSAITPVHTATKDNYFAHLQTTLQL
jgi:hypothetical protein